MARYLVVANQTLGGEHLIARIRERMAAEPSSFHIVVPATPLPGHATWKEGEATSVAQARLDRARTRSLPSRTPCGERASTRSSC
jgi:hypothetical protein